MRALLNDFMETIWPKRWLRVRDLENGTMVLMSMHRTSASALLAINDPLSERVKHVNDLAPSSLLMRW